MPFFIISFSRSPGFFNKLSKLPPFIKLETPEGPEAAIANAARVLLTYELTLKSKSFTGWVSPFLEMD